MTKAIEGFQGEFRFLSNFWIAEIVYNENTYRSSEHAYQAAKAITEEDRAYVANAFTPGEAKRRGRKIVVREDWDRVKIRIMSDILYEKFEQHPELAEKLLATGNVMLVESNMWHDLYYGKCMCSRHKGEGQNVLGKLLMSVRCILRVKQEEEKEDINALWGEEPR